MKITKKQPLRPRGRSDEKRQSTKDAIREAYANGPQKEVQIIPAKKDLVTDAEKKKLRVCAYCRVSTEEDNQASSYELQVQNYTKMIQENPEWEFAGIFADEGISGTSVLHREHFLEMIEKCKAGEIDLIITKQVSRFARNVLDSLNYIFMLRKLDPPVGVYFETEKLNTWRRLIVIPFNAKIEGKSDIKNYGDYLYQNAAESILAWIIEGAKKVIDLGYKFPVPAIVQKAIDDYRSQNDWFGNFLAEKCEVGDGLKESSSTLYQAYRNYCLDCNEYVRNTADFYLALENAGFERLVLNRKRYFKGLKLKTDDGDFEDFLN